MRGSHDRRADGVAYAAAASTAYGLGDVRPPVLTPRERQVLRLRALGYRHAQIGVALGISEQTAKNHSDSVYGKTDARCLADALRAVGWLVVPAA